MYIIKIHFKKDIRVIVKLIEEDKESVEKFIDLVYDNYHSVDKICWRKIHA